MSSLPLAGLRKDYRKATLDEKGVLEDPFRQFEKWFGEALHCEVAEPSAMTLATSTVEGRPSARILLLKGFNEQGFYFFSNYESRKAQQIAANPFGAIVFFWKELERQVRAEGRLRKASDGESDAYYASRPEGSRIGAWASPQSQVIPGRAYLENRVQEFTARFSGKQVPRPPYWGGYILEPETVEFWQGRSNRLHDRIQYSLQAGGRWKIRRLAP